MKVFLKLVQNLCTWHQQMRVTEEDWWQQVGSMLIPANPTLSDFAKVFLARFVKPSDSAAARIEITTRKQTGSFEAFAAHFRNVNSRIVVGRPIDTTTLATHFINGLNGKVVKALATVNSLKTMQNLDAPAWTLYRPLACYNAPHDNH